LISESHASIVEAKRDVIAMADVYPPLESPLASPASVFPTLTPPQIERLSAHGILRQVQAGEVLVEAGDQAAPLFVIKTGQVEVVQPSGATEKAVALFLPGQFTGELRIVSGQRILARVRAKEAGEVIEINRDHLLALLQTDSELSVSVRPTAFQPIRRPEA
jgi:thioredoxin reductase (NADPH)